MKNGGSFHSYVSLPEGITKQIPDVVTNSELLMLF